MSIKKFAKQNNLYYENIAAYVNELNQLGYTAEELDAPKHVIASAHSVVEQGQSTSNDFKPAGNALPEPGSDVQTDHMASLADVDEFDIHRMAEEVFSSMTLDDWASTPDDYDPFEHLDPMHNGVLPRMDSSKRSITR